MVKDAIKVAHVETVFALIAGSVIGAVLGFIGAGGAMVSVPILTKIFDFPIHQATIAALPIVFAGAISGLYGRIKRNEVLIKEALTISGIGLITNVAGARISQSLPDLFIKLGFALILVSAGISMVRKHNYSTEREIGTPLLVFLALVIGSFTGIFGVGGGFLAIPVLVRGFHVPLSKAAGTSLLIISLNSLIALIAHFDSWGAIPWHIPVLMSISAILVATIAGHQVTKISPEKLRQSFAVLLFVIAIYTLF